jgi:ribose 5-phosphate isomerase RpiB
MIFTARQLQELHKTNGHVTVPVGSRMTPLAQDWLRAKKVALKYGTNGSAMEKPPTSAVGPTQTTQTEQKALPITFAPPGTLLWWCDGPCGQAKAAIAQQSRESSLQPLDLPASADNLIPAIKRIAGDVKSGRASGGILLVQSGSAAIVYSNRCPSLRAILGTCRQSVEQGVQQLAANVLIIEYPYHSLPQVRNLLVPFVRARRELSDDVKRQIEELSGCG